MHNGKRPCHQHWLSHSSLFPICSHKLWTLGHRKPTKESLSPPHLLILVESESLGKEHITLFHAVKDEKEMVLFLSSLSYSQSIVRVTHWRHDKYERFLKNILYVTLKSIKRHFPPLLWVFKCFWSWENTE